MNQTRANALGIMGIYLLVLAVNSGDSWIDYFTLMVSFFFYIAFLLFSGGKDHE